MKNEIGNNIRKYRDIRHMSQKQLAERLDIKNNRVSNWEQGLNNPPADMIAKICEVLNISASELLGVKLAENELSEEERSVIREYRTRVSMQHAVKVLLGIEEV
ncbi:MAG: helix-turn-helix transcriptional regulator [Lachnospiraceae bacterium]|nr:helix-turn-helix transcriptional regulator [Lachnospiraceae bacterium]